MLFTPMLPEVAGGSIAGRDIMQPLRAAFGDRKRGSSIAFELGEAVNVDVHGRSVTIRHPVNGSEKRLDYDELVLALGSTASSMGVSGVEEFAVPFKTIADAEIVRSRVVGALELAATSNDLLERDRLLRFVVVGGNFTGVELAGELNAFLGSALNDYPGIDPRAVELVVLESGEKLLGRLPEKFGRYAASVLGKRGIRLRLKQDVATVDAHGATLKSGERIPSATVLWAAGEKPAPLAESLGLKTDKHGAIETAADLSVPGTAHVWALGDCAAVPKAHGGTYAPLAQNAIKQGVLLGRNIAARARGRTTYPFTYRELGQMASLGNRVAVAELPGGRMITGLPAWLMWRSYYLAHVPGLSDKARIACDWTLGLIFPARTSRLPALEKSTTSFASDHAGEEKSHAAGR
jgi:NADH dehydrogenase